MKKSILTFFVTLLLLNSIFVSNFFWSFFTGVWFLKGFEQDYNRWNNAYISKDFSKALSSYSGALTYNNTEYALFHNIWNTHYNMWDLSSAVEAYQQALNRAADPHTQKNLEFVQNILDTMQEKAEPDTAQQDQQQQDSSANESETWEDSWSTNEITDTQELWTTEQARAHQDSQKLDTDTQAALKERQETLEQSQQELQKYYNRNYRENTSNTLFDTLFNNSALQQNTWEKDW